MKIKQIISIILASVMVTGIVPFNAFAAANKSISVTVGKGDGYNFNTIQGALDSIKETPTEKFPATISIAPGTYEEDVVVDLPYVKLESTDKNGEVIITYDKANGNADPAKNFGTDKTATFMVNETAVGFSAENITFQNSYNINTENKQTQAVAFESMADKVVLKNCKFIGRQDTLYLKGASKGQNEYGSANNARVYIADSYIEGTVDFIFGDATAYFDNCELYMTEYENGGHFTAPNTTLFNIGYVFNECKLSTSDKFSEEVISKIDLGRPWQCDAAYPNSGSNTVYINCTMPERYNTAGFSTWDSNTIENKIRFYEYNSVDSSGRVIDTSNRASFVKQLTAEQASYYNAYNVLKGNDSWNPLKKAGVVGAADITLNEYNISVPQDETYQLKVIALPMENEGAVSYESSDTGVAEINANGVIKAKALGTAKVSAILPSGLKATANVTVTAPRTELPEISHLSMTSNNTIMVGNIVKADYSYKLTSDNDIDAAKIRWYAVKDNKEYLIKEGVGEYYKSYTVQSRDVGCRLKIEVLPATETTYGEYGNVVSYLSEKIIASNVETSEVLLRDNFDNGTDGYTAVGQWTTINNGYNNFITANSTSDSPTTLFYNNGSKWGDVNFVGRYRFNPTEKGLASDGEFSIYFDYSENSYYRLKLGRGSNTKSLKLYLYKKTADSDEETLLASDESSLKNNIYQNAGEDNPYFNIVINKSGSNISIEFRLEDNDTKLAKLTATDNDSIVGTIGFEAKGAANVVLIDSISVEGSVNEGSENKIRLFLLGDSTAKNYGDDNTIGGWGEYLVNYFDGDVEIINKAEGGRSARSYLNQGRLKEVTDQLTPEDYVFVQFGTNDQRTDDNAYLEHSVVLGEPDEYGIYPTNPAYKCKTPDTLYNNYKNTEYPYDTTFYPYDSGTFKWYMKQHIDAIKKTGAKPVLLTPMCRMFFDSDGKITPHFGDNDGYITAIKQLAEEEGIMCIDMYEITKQLYESYGILTTQGLHNVKEDGTVDLTHYNKFGANLIASKMADRIKEETDLSISSHIITSSVAVEKTTDLKTANLFVVGGTYAEDDSTADYYIQGDGFGNYLQKYLSSKITVKNLALAGTTAKTYTATDNYNELMNSVQQGDYVILSFGNDDCKSNIDSVIDGTVEDKNSFAGYMYNYYIKPLLEKNVIIVMLTPFAERRYDTNGAFDPAVFKQTDILTQLVVDYGLYFVNTYDVSSEIYTTMGEEGGKVLNAYDESGLMANTLSEFGADLMAKRILNNLTYSSISLKDYVLTDKINSNSKMTRADFICMVMNVLKVKGEANTNFDDVTKGKYYYDAIGLAKTYGIVEATENNKIEPEAALNGEMVQSILENASKFMAKNTDLADVYGLAKGEIAPEIGIWAVDRLYEELNK